MNINVFNILHSDIIWNNVSSLQRHLLKPMSSILMRQVLFFQFLYFFLQLVLLQHWFFILLLNGPVILLETTTLMGFPFLLFNIFDVFFAETDFFHQSMNFKLFCLPFFELIFEFLPQVLNLLLLKSQFFLKFGMDILFVGDPSIKEKVHGLHLIRLKCRYQVVFSIQLGFQTQVLLLQFSVNLQNIVSFFQIFCYFRAVAV